MVCRRKSLRPMRAHLKRLKDFFRHYRAASISSAAIRKYILARKKDGAARATIDRELELLRRAFALGVESRKVAFAPNVPKLPALHENARRGFLDVDSFEKVLGAIQDPDFQDYLEWFWWTGMRPGEIAALSWADYDVQTKTLRLGAADAKIGEGRVVPIFGPLAPTIQRRRAVRSLKSLLVFHSGGGSFASRRNGYRTGSTGCGTAPARRPGFRARRPPTTSRFRRASGSFPTTSVARPCGACALRVSRSAWRWRSPGTRPGACSTATESSTSGTSEPPSRDEPSTKPPYRPRGRSFRSRTRPQDCARTQGPGKTTVAA